MKIVSSMSELSSEFALTFGDYATTRRWDERIATLDELRELVAHRDIRPNKDGTCVIGATLLDGKREANSVETVGVLIFDIDGKQSLDEVDALLDAANVTAYLYTTHNHRKTRTNIVVDHYERWAKTHKKPLTPTLALMTEYLASKNKGPFGNLRFEDDWYERVAGEGNVYFVRHEPVDKMRVIIPLSTPIVLGTLAASNREVNDAYKRIYCGVGTTLGLAFDVSCADPCRLHYLPSCPKEMAEHARAREFDGPLLDWTQYKLVSPLRARGDTANAANSLRVMIGDRNLNRWAPNFGAFEIEGFLDQLLPDQILSARNRGGHTITCPFEAQHSQPGGAGTFASNGDGQYFWQIHCSHASCQDAGRKRLDFIAEWIKQGFVSVEQLEAFSGHKVPREESAVSVMQKLLSRKGKML